MILPPRLIYARDGGGALTNGRLTHDFFGTRSPPHFFRSNYYISGGEELYAHQDDNGQTVIDGEVTSHLWWNHYRAVEDIATVHDVPRDAHCGYYALLRYLYPTLPVSEEAAVEFRKKLWHFVDDYFEDIKQLKLVPVYYSKIETLCEIYGGEGNDHNNERFYMSDYILQFVALMEEKSVFLYIQEMTLAPYSTMETVVFFYDELKKKLDRYNFMEKVTAPTQNAIGIYLKCGHFQHVEYKDLEDDD